MSLDGLEVLGREAQLPGDVAVPPTGEALVDERLERRLVRRDEGQALQDRDEDVPGDVHEAVGLVESLQLRAGGRRGGHCWRVKTDGNTDEMMLVWLLGR